MPLRNIENVPTYQVCFKQTFIIEILRNNCGCQIFSVVCSEKSVFEMDLIPVVRGHFNVIVTFLQRSKVIFFNMHILKFQFLDRSRTQGI